MAHGPGPLTADDYQNAINAIENARYLGRDAANVAAMLGRFRQALAEARKPAPTATPLALRLPPGPAVPSNGGAVTDAED